MRSLFGSFLFARYVLALRKFVLEGTGLTFSLKSLIACMFIIFFALGAAIDNSVARLLDYYICCAGPAINNPGQELLPGGYSRKFWIGVCEGP